MTPSSGSIAAPSLSSASFATERWYVAGFSWELKDKPIARTFLDRPVVLFRNTNGEVAALEDRCCHRELPLSCGTVEARGLRCGYHGLLYDGTGSCIEIPGQSRVPPKARVQSYPLREQDQILWIWIGATPDSHPSEGPPGYPIHSDPKYGFEGGIYHYEAPYQLIHDNLLDLSHLGYVHLKTIGGDAGTHMNAELDVSQEGEMVRVVRWMPDSEPPPTYLSAWPFKGRIDRWQEVEFHPSHLLIWTGAMEVGADRRDNPAREGFHMRGFHGVTPETESTSHYFWTVAINSHPDKDKVLEPVIKQVQATFDEDRVVIEAQYRNRLRFGARPLIDIHVDAGPNRARRIIDRLLKETPAAP